jgi:hypothetical protein
MGERLERPGECRRSGLVARHEQRHQLVAKFLVRHARAVVVAGLEQQREHVVALGEVRRVAAGADLLVDERVGRIQGGPQRASLRDPARAEQRELRHPARLGGPGEAGPQHLAEALHARAVPDPEDGPHDHLERDRLHGRPGAHRHTRGQALALARGHVGHCLLVAPHPLAVERRQHQLALCHVGVVVEQEHRMAPEDGHQHDVGLARVKQPRVAGEDLLDRIGMADEDPGALVGDPERERVPVAPRGVLHEPGGPGDPASGLKRAVRLWAGWQLGMNGGQ